MRGGGFYDAHSSGQRAAMDEFLSWIVEAVADLQRGGLDVGVARDASAAPQLALTSGAAGASRGRLGARGRSSGVGAAIP
jgi:hypothetical protein